MTSSTLLYLLTYAAFITFVVSVAVRAYRIQAMPVHLRWELYPVAHEGKRAHYGGSYFEELDWWTKPRKFSLIGELKGMVPEMLFMKALWENNRPLWYRSFPFHFGLYCLIGWAALLIVGAVAQVAGIQVGSGSGLGGAIHYLTILAGAFGLVLSNIGAIALLHRRLTDEEVDGYTSPAHIFNLLFFLVALLTGFLAYILADQTFSIARGYVYSLITFKIVAPVGSSAVAAEFVLFSLLMAYVPLTHMSHFFTKFFFYHRIRWDDKPNFKGSKLEKRITEALGYPVRWSASHLKADGMKYWADIATEEVE
ncbi:MAG: respiratory nitrate reductase subunit gamma [Candidatus Hydrogenedentota bacterium]|nr:MAG: respiratory nitrate reductase subunit gamma [Candidatus Hydrogenedentota bacterium]